MKKTALIVLGLLLLALLFSSAYRVQEGQQVIVTQFGEPVGDAITKAGLHFKMPFVQDLRVFEKRILEWDGDPNQIPTHDKKYINIDTTARWRIAEPLIFLESVQNEDRAQARLDDILDGETRISIPDHDLIEAVRNTNREMLLDVELSQGDEETEQPQSDEILVGRSRLTQMIFERAAPQVEEYGIELIDLRIKKINYVEDVRLKVYQRMVSERQKIADKTRSEGQGKKAEIDGKREKDLKAIQSEAYRQAEEIRGRADAEAAAIFAEAYSRNPEFYAFVKSLETYEQVLDQGTLLMLSTDSDFLRYLPAPGTGD